MTCPSLMQEHDKEKPRQGREINSPRRKPWELDSDRDKPRKGRKRPRRPAQVCWIHRIRSLYGV